MTIVPSLSSTLAACFVAAVLSTPALAQFYQPPVASRHIVQNIGLDRATPVSEEYRAEFARCDRENVFRGRAQTRKCSNDPNNLKALLRLPSGAVFLDAKMGLDLDGSWLSWNNPGKSDLKDTWLQWCQQTKRSCQVDPEVFPYVVIPIAGPAADRREFTRLTGVDKGDFGVVVLGDRWMATFVADGGPYNKFGEGAASALAGLGVDRCRAKNAAGNCTKFLDASIEGGVLYILFPGSARADMTPANANALAKAEACRRLALPGCS